MSGFNEQDLIQFWKDANSYQSIDVACFDIEEFKDNWVRDKIGHEALKKANGATTGEKQCNLPVVINWALIEDSKYPKDEWLLVVTADKAHHVAYYSSSYNKWIANSKFGEKPLWWASLPEPPCL